MMKKLTTVRLRGQEAQIDTELAIKFKKFKVQKRSLILNRHSKVVILTTRANN